VLGAIDEADYRPRRVVLHVSRETADVGDSKIIDPLTYLLAAGRLAPGALGIFSVCCGRPTFSARVLGSNQTIGRRRR
jgi:hypothetical protein